MPTPTNLAITADRPSATLLVTISGELDAASTVDLVAEVSAYLSPEIERISLYLGELTFCDSAGLQALLRLQEHAERLRIDMVIQTISRQVARLVALTGLTARLNQGSATLPPTLHP